MGNKGSSFEQGKQSAQQGAEKAKEGFAAVADKAKEGVQHIREGIGAAADKAREAVGSAVEKAREGLGSMGESASHMASAAVNKADDAVSAAGRRLEDWGEGVRSRTPNEGLLGSASEAVACTLEKSGKYLEDHGLTGMVDDVTDMIKRNPIPALFVGIGIGFLLAKATSSSSRS